MSLFVGGAASQRDSTGFNGAASPGAVRGKTKRRRRQKTHGAGFAEVSFQMKNPDFLSKNPDFLSEILIPY